MIPFRAHVPQALRILLIVAVVLTLDAASLAAAAGTNYYVDGVNGSDSNSGTSSTSAWKSLSAVQSRTFQAGDTVNFARGSKWTGNLSFRSSGAAGNPITLKAYGSGAAPTISNTSGGYSHSIDIYGSYVVVQDFLTRDASEAGIMIDSGANYVTVQNNELTAVGTGVYVRGSNAKVTGNNVYDLKMVVNTPGGDDDYGANGIFVSNASNTEVSYNRFVNCRASSYDYGSDGGMLEIWGNVSNLNVHHNYSRGANGVVEIGGGSANNVTFAYNISDRDYSAFAMLHLSGNFASSMSNFKVENNTIVKPTQEYRVLDFGGSSAPSSFIFRNNVVYSATSVASSSSFTHTNNLYYLYNGASLGFSLGSGEKQADPRFVNFGGGDYHLQSGSPAIDAGANLGYTQDFDGRAVPSGAGPDMGAFEFGSSTGASPTASPVPTTATPVPPTATPVPTTATPAPPKATPAAPASTLQTGLVGFWKMDEGSGTATSDSSGKGLAGSLFNAPSWIAGRIGKALGFNGSSSYARVNDNDALSPLATSGEITVAAWVNLGQRPSTSGQGRAPFVAKTSGGNSEYALYAYANGTVGFSIWNLNGNSYGEPSGGSLPLNGWHNVVGTTKNGQFVRVYLDGNLVGQTTSLSGSTGSGSAPLYFARRADGQYLKTGLDEVRIYNRVLSLTEIQLLTK